MKTTTDKDLLKVSRRMSFILRHDPASAGLEMSSSGEVDLVGLAEALEVPVDAIALIVEDDEKGRYVIEDGKIWATQGHSVHVEGRATRLESAEFIYHGTKLQFLDSIREGGLQPGERQYVHLSIDVETAINVAGRRKGESVILKIDANKMIKEGYVVLQASNGVILTKSIPWEFVSDALDV